MVPTPAEKAAAEAARKAMDTYAAPEYWDNRYAETACEPYDWYVKWSHLKDPLKAFKLNLAAHSQVLVAGCGTSSVCEDLVLDNVPQVTNFDRCKPLVEAMAERHQEKSSVRFVAMDAEHLPEEWEEQYDMIFDKGLLDVVCTQANGARKVQKILDRYSKCLRLTNAFFVCVSHAPELFRAKHLLGPSAKPFSPEAGEYPKVLGESVDYGWKVNVTTVERPQEGLEKTKAFNEKEDIYYIYVCEKIRM